MEPLHRLHRRRARRRQGRSRALPVGRAEHLRAARALRRGAGAGAACSSCATHGVSRAVRARGRLRSVRRRHRAADRQRRARPGSPSSASRRSTRAPTPSRRATPAIAAAILAQRADAVVFGGKPGPGAQALWTELHKLAPRVRSCSRRARWRRTAFLAGLGSAADRHLRGDADPRWRQYPAARAAHVAAYRRRFGVSPTPYALYGYEAMRDVLAAIQRAGPEATNRATLLRASSTSATHPRRDRRLPITRDGDTTLKTRRLLPRRRARPARAARARRLKCRRSPRCGAHRIGPRSRGAAPRGATRSRTARLRVHSPDRQPASCSRSAVVLAGCGTSARPSRAATTPSARRR